MLIEAKLALGRRLGSQQPKHEAHQNIRATLILFLSALVLNRQRIQSFKNTFQMSIAALLIYQASFFVYFY